MKMLTVLILTLSSLNVFSATLQCWKTNFTQARVPFLSAVIHNDEVLSDLRYYYKENGKVPAAPKGKVVGELIETNRSPYKGMNDFNIKASTWGMYRLLLPADLSSQNLAVEAKYDRKEENAVIIGDFDGDGAGSHFSIRLTCSSDKE